MGKPSEKEPWGFQLDGHHLIVNYFVLCDQVVMTPAFWGSEPVVAESAWTSTNVRMIERVDMDVPQEETGGVIARGG